MKKKYLKGVFMVFVLGLLATACYNTFDSNSYKPKFTINGFSAADQIKPDNLVGYWAFDGSLIDSVSGTAGNNAGATFVNGFEGEALGLDAASKSYVTFNPNSALTTGLGSFTISFWVDPTFVDSNGDGAIDGILGLVNLSNTTNFWGNIDWFVENGSNDDAAILKIHITNDTLDTWLVKNGYKGLFDGWTNHTLTYDASTSTFVYYINGSVVVPATTPPWTGPVNFTKSGPYVFGCVQFQTTPSLTSGSTSQPWASYLTGSLDEVRIYNTALTADEVNSLVVLQGKGK